MSSEAGLWDSIRANVGHRGHFSRIEYNPSAGYPDLSYCIKGEEGHIELKHIDQAPVRPTTQVFGEKGLRDAQIAWAHTRCKHGGRVYIVARVGLVIFVVPGIHCRRFNQMTYFQLGKAAIWCDRPGWDGFLSALKRPMPRYPGIAPEGSDHGG